MFPTSLVLRGYAVTWLRICYCIFKYTRQMWMRRRRMAFWMRKWCSFFDDRPRKRAIKKLKMCSKLMMTPSVVRLEPKCGKLSLIKTGFKKIYVSLAKFYLKRWFAFAWVSSFSRSFLTLIKYLVESNVFPFFVLNVVRNLRKIGKGLLDEFPKLVSQVPYLSFLK